MVCQTQDARALNQDFFLLCLHVLTLLKSDQASQAHVCLNVCKCGDFGLDPSHISHPADLNR